METVFSWWGLIVVAVVAAGYAVFRWEHAKTVAAALMIRAEKEARARALATGEAKLVWVAETSYPYLPGVVRIVVSPMLWKKIVQALWDAAKRWAEKQPVPKI